MVEERLIIGQRLLMMHVVFRSPAHQIERAPVMQQIWEIEPNVGLNTDPDDDKHIRPDSEGVRAKEPGVSGGKHADSDQFPRVQIFGHPHERTRVAVVQAVDVAV